jgi:predicted MFS family arabinose efflux permease
MDTTATRARPPGSVLRRHDYRMLLASAATSRAGDFLYLVAMSVYVFDRTGSAAWVSAAALGRFLPSVLLSPVAGVIADRYERRRLMIAGDLAQLAAMAALTVAAAVAAPALLVVALSTAAAAAATVQRACSSAMVQTVVPEDELAAANSLLNTVDTITFVVGPAAGGLLLLLGAPAVAFGLNAATFAVSAAFLLAMHARSTPGASPERGGTVGELREGVAAFLGNRTVVVLIGCVVAETFVYGVEIVLLVLVSTELLGTGAPGLGWLLAASGAGGLIGAALSARLAAATRPRTVIAVLVLLTGLPLASLSVVRAPAVAYAVLLVEGAAIVALDILSETALQRGVATEVLGPGAGLAISLTAIGTAAGTLLAPVLVDAVGLPIALAAAGTVPVVLAAASLLLLPGFDAAADRTRRALAPRVALLARLPLFDGVDVAAVERLAAAVTEQRAPAGTQVLRQGDPTDDLYILVEGTVVVDHTVDGVVRPINELTAPDYVGEIGLVQHRPRTATVTAASDVLLWRLPGPLFLDAVTGVSTLPVGLSRAIASRLARTPAAR